MKIKRKLFIYKDTFGAILICEHCDHEMKITSGRNNSNFHSIVLPSMICPSCHVDRNKQATRRFFNGCENP